jgi:hypothetical protein
MKSLDGGPGAFRGYHRYIAKTERLLIRAINHDINLCDIAISGKQIFQFVLCKGRGDVFNIYPGGHNSVQSLSQIFFRVAYPVEPLSFKFVLNHPPPPLFESICDGPGKEPDLFEQLDDCQTDEFKSFHSRGFGFNSPQSARCGKKRPTCHDFGFCESFFMTETSGLVLCFSSSWQ